MNILNMRTKISCHRNGNKYKSSFYLKVAKLRMRTPDSPVDGAIFIFKVSLTKIYNFSRESLSKYWIR